MNDATIDEQRAAEIGKALARSVFELGGRHSDQPVTRMQYMHGRYPIHEKPGGGLCEEALADHLAETLLKHSAFTRKDER